MLISFMSAVCPQLLASVLSKNLIFIYLFMDCVQATLVCHELTRDLKVKGEHELLHEVALLCSPDHEDFGLPVIMSVCVYAALLVGAKNLLLHKGISWCVIRSVPGLKYRVYNFLEYISFQFWFTFEVISVAKCPYFCFQVMEKLQRGGLIEVLRLSGPLLLSCSVFVLLFSRAVGELRGEGMNGAAEAPVLLTGAVRRLLVCRVGHSF